MADDSCDCFISYASVDLELAEALHKRLVEAEFNVWFDRVRLEPGCDWHQQIEAGCERSRVVLPILTPQWKLSEWTRYETYGHDRVIPLIADGEIAEVLTPPLRRWQAKRFNPLIADKAAWQSLFTAIRNKLSEPVPEQAPRIIDLPYPANPFFTGRESDLVRIHEELHEAPVAALIQGRVRALAAMGGVGKTTLANEYARRFWRLYPQILWVDARRGYHSEFALLFDKLFPNRATEMKQEEKAVQALAELNGKRERLLVIDNVDDAESAHPWLPRSAATGCRTLITSRFSDWPQAAGVRAIALQVLEKASARQFLLMRTGRSVEGEELDACDALAEALGYLPLALEQAGAYMAAPGAGVDFVAYLRLYKSATAELLARGALGSTRYPDPVITTWQATVAKLSADSRAVLRLCSWYADTPIPRELVMGGVADVLALSKSFGTMLPLSGSAADELRMRDALSGLARYSMILDATDATFRAHGLVQTVERVRATADGNDAVSQDIALQRMKSVFPDGVFDDSGTWPLCRLLLPHIEALDRNIGDAIPRPTLADLLEAAGRYLHGSGSLREAEIFLRRALAKHEQAKGKEDIAAAGCAHNLAHCLNDLGNSVEAAPLLRGVLAIYKKAIGNNHRNTLTCMNDLAVTVGKEGNFLEAAEQLSRVLASEEQIFGPDHEATLRTLDNLAHCTRALGDLAAALPLARRAYEGRSRTFGEEHADSLRSLGNLAMSMEALGDAAGALPLYRRVLEIQERELGQEHPSTIISLGNFAICMGSVGDSAGALPLHHRALEICQRILGLEHPATLTSINNLAACMQALGDSAGALPLYRHVLECRDRAHGKDHPDRLISMNNLAHCLQSLGDAKAALPLFKQALEVQERLLGLEHPRVLIGTNNLVSCMQALGDPAGALPLCRNAFERSEHTLGPTHPTTLTIAGTLAACLDKLGRLDEAEPLHRRKVDGLERRLGGDHSEVLTACNNLAASMRKGGRPDLALPFARRVAESSERILVEANPLLVHRRNNLALTLLMTGETIEVGEVLALNRTSRAPSFANTTPCVVFLSLVAELLNGGTGAGAIGQLKMLLLGPKLSIAPDVAHPWDVGYLLDYLAPRLHEGDLAHLKSLLACINDPDLVPVLDRFPAWRDAE